MSLSDVTYDPAAFTSLSTVDFLRLTADDTGFYKCEVEYVYKNGTSTYSTLFESQVGELYIVSFQIDLPSNSYNLLGSAVTLTAVTKGPNEPKTVTWTVFKGKEILLCIHRRNCSETCTIKLKLKCIFGIEERIFETWTLMKILQKGQKTRQD